MKSDFIKVTNIVNEISSKKVIFDKYTVIPKKWHGILLWKLLKDGIYVRKEYANNYGLNKAT